MRKRLLTLVILLFSFMQLAFAQLLRQPITAIYTGMGAYSNKHSDVFSFQNNQAALARTKNVAAGIYGENRFSMAATRLYAAAVAIPSGKGNFGFNIKYAGFKNFNESQMGLAYARGLGSAVDIGVQFNYYNYRIPAYSNTGTVNFEAGALIHLNKLLTAGIHVYNPVGGNFSKTDEKLTAAYRFGLGYDASDKFFVSAELVHQEGYPLNINAVMQYQFMKQFFARAGISSAAAATYAGAGISWSNLQLHICGSYHPQLGWSPGLMLLIDLGNEKEATVMK